MDPARLAADLKGKSENPKAVIASNFVLTGTASNCSGGVLPEGWVTCEESGRAGHGYAFLTRPGDEKLMAPRPIKGWGRFPREGIVLDAATGVVYMTEDRWDGCFYRYVPTNPKDYMGPGRLQALSIKGLKTTSPYPKPKDDQPTPRLWKDNQTWAVTWVDIDDPSAAKVTCRAQAIAKGATTFSRSEGIAWSGRSAWLSASLGGPAGAGQIFEYLPDASNSDVGKLVLRYEVSDRSILSCPDNVCMAPWQDLVMAEDNYSKNHQVTHQYIRGMDQKGRVYDIARNRRHFPGSKKPGAEFAGVCFSPDGKYLFVNLQSPENVTVAIKGPWA